MSIPEGYELATVSAAKNHAMDILEKELEAAGIEVYGDDDVEEQVNLVSLADAVIEGLLKAGMVVPDDMKDPNYAK